jgi:hypothetical protein
MLDYMSPWFFFVTIQCQKLFPKESPTTPKKKKTSKKKEKGKERNAIF